MRVSVSDRFITPTSFTTLRRRVTSGASRQFNIFKSYLPYRIHFKKLYYKTPWLAGRSRSRGIVCLSKGSRASNHRRPIVLTTFRDTRISFIASFLVSPFRHKLVSLMILSSGSVAYLSSNNHTPLFALACFAGRKGKYKAPDLVPTFFLIKDLPKNAPVSLLESVPGKGVQYSRSPGTKSTILKMDSRLGTSLVRLPSGVRRIFSIYSTGSRGPVPLADSSRLKITKAGYYRTFGKKPRVRGVARNPVDHPHGGRTKSIHNPRTPWGVPTKRK